MFVKNVEKPHFFKESALAHTYLDGLTGIEAGASSHNSFGLEGSINVAPGDDEFFRDNEIKLCGHYAEVGIVAEGDDIPVANDSQDYVISSHVLEHMPNLFKAFLEWNRIVKPGGYIFMIVPKRDAHPPDAKRPISPISDVIRAWQENWNVDTALAGSAAAAGIRRGHYWVFTLESLLEIIEVANLLLPLDWEIVEALETDDKVANGHCVVCRTREVPLSKGLREATEAEANREAPINLRRNTK